LGCHTLLRLQSQSHSSETPQLHHVQAQLLVADAPHIGVSMQQQQI
jgi:hypothetical protein